MNRAQWLLVGFVGVVALVAFQRTEVLSQRLGMSGIIPVRKTSGSGIV